MKLSKKILFSLILGLFSISTSALAEDTFPKDNIRFIVPYAPGGPLDTVARLLGEKIQKNTGQAVIIENKAGAGGNIGIKTMLKEKADGYTLAMGAVATMAINPWIYSKIPFDASKDFAPVLLVADVPNVLIINKDFAQAQHIDSFQQLIQYIKAHPGELNYASGGTGSAGHLAGELLKAKLGIDMVHAPFQGASPAKLSLLANQTQLMFDNLASAKTLIDDGKVIALAVSTHHRSPFLPNLPTLEEEGIKDFDIGTWFGIIAPAGTPETVINTLNQLYAAAMDDPAVQKQLETMGSAVKPGSAADFTAFAKKELAKYKEIVNTAHAKIH